ncbi:U2 snRNP component prp10 [Savitreella phatthalungensis]
MVTVERPPRADSPSRHSLAKRFTAPKEFLQDFVDENDATTGVRAIDKHAMRQIAVRESDYQRRRFDRRDYAEDGEGEDEEHRLRRLEIEREEQRVRLEIERRRQTGTLEQAPARYTPVPDHEGARTPARPVLEGDRTPTREEYYAQLEQPASEHQEYEREIGRLPERKRRWDPTADDIHGSPDGRAATDASESETPIKKSRWDAGPDEVAGPETKRRSRWDMADDQQAQETQPAAEAAQDAQPRVARGVPISDEELNELLPKEGYRILDPPPGYEPLNAPINRVTEGLFSLPESGVMPATDDGVIPGDLSGAGDLQFFKKEDAKHFAKLMDGTKETDLSLDELKERKVMRLILKVKNGTPQARKVALRQLTDRVRDFGADALFKQILPLMMERSLEDQERHLLVKIIDRILYKLDDLIRPWTHRILVVIQPMLVDEDFTTRAEGREIIANLSKAAGLAHMIQTMRPDIDHADEYVRNTTSRAFAVVAGALGIPALLPFLRAVCRSKRSWQARHTGVKIVQQVGVLIGPGLLPHLNGLVECIQGGLDDEQQKVRTMTALAIAALAEASAPYGIESFDSCLRPLWDGVRRQRGRPLSAFLRACGQIVPLMDPEWADTFTQRVMSVVTREFTSPDDDMQRVVLKVVQQCASTEGVSPAYLRDEVLADFFRNFFEPRTASDRRLNRLVIDTAVVLAAKVGSHEIVSQCVDCMKDENEAFRRMAVETVDKVVRLHGLAGVDERLEERLVDGVLFAFQEQTVEDDVMLDAFGTVINTLRHRCKPYLPQIVSSILWRLNNKSPTVRQQSADLVTRIAATCKLCDEEQLLHKLALVLYEYLGEEYPDVLGSILSGLRGIVAVVGMSSMEPSISDLLPRLTPILRNRHEKVQENVVDLVGAIADRGSEHVSAREWMRICFELLEMLKAHKRGIRRAAINTFGFIAKAIGPSDVLATLLNNLRVQERQNRVCTTVAIAIVAETCAPFTVVPALMAEYRVPELTVRTGVLKSLAFMFEYIGPMGRDYAYAVAPLLEDAMLDRDPVHRQTAATAIRHLALGCAGLGAEDLLIHLLNLVWPNIFETSPHVINAVSDAVLALAHALGPGILLNYLLPGLFHPARNVRNIYTRLYNDLYIRAAAALPAYMPLISPPTGNAPDTDAVQQTPSLAHDNQAADEILYRHKGAYDVQHPAMLWL